MSFTIPRREAGEPARVIAAGARPVAPVGELAEYDMWLVYEPLIDLADGHVRGHQARLRAADRRGMVVDRRTIVSNAAERGVADLLQSWICDEALAAGGGDTFMAIGVSAAQLAFEDDAQDLLDLVAASDRAPGDLQLEFDARSSPAMNATPGLEILARAGGRLALGGFGDGCWTFADVARLPVTDVKIARSLIASAHVDADAREHLRSVANRLAALAVTVTARGIERPAHLGLLRGLPVELGQGPLFCRGAHIAMGAQHAIN